MGTGEPFDNYDNVMDFVRIINHPNGSSNRMQDILQYQHVV